MAMNAMNQPASQKTSGLAITSLVFGILSLCCTAFVPAIVAIICGHISRGQIKKSEGSIGGGGVAMAGLILGYIGLAFSILAVVFWTMFGAKAYELGLNTQNAMTIQLATERMVSDGESKGDKSLGWPADAGITTATELKKRLVDNGYLTTEEAATIDFNKFDFGNVSAEDPESTVFVKFRNKFMGATVYYPKSGLQETVPAPGDTSDVDPKRTPAYLAP
jgi:hypothetical protein